MDNDAHNTVSSELSNALRIFKAGCDPVRASINLRTVFFEYLRHTSCGLAANFDEVLDDIEALFELVDALAGEKVK